MLPLDRFGYGRGAVRSDTQKPKRPRIKSDLEKAQDRIEELNQALEAHEERIEHLEACVHALMQHTGVKVTRLIP
jgi:predicted  nucleic acid-binding Zn-ribbon protein